MKDFSLCRELSIKLSSILGATPFSIGKIGLTHKDLSKNTIKISNDDNSETQIPIWYGEAFGEEGTMCCLLAGLDIDPAQLEIACVIGFKDFDNQFRNDGFRLSFHYDWTNEEDPGTMVMRAGDKWLPISLAQRLQLLFGFETMVQDGIEWKVGEIPPELKDDLVSLIELD
jgi:hypothetical protein